MGFPDNDYLLLRDEPGMRDSDDAHDDFCPDPRCERCRKRGAHDGWNNDYEELIAHPDDPDLRFHSKCLDAELAEENAS
jgi:hypothetical protein